MSDSLPSPSRVPRKEIPMNVAQSIRILRSTGPDAFPRSSSSAPLPAASRATTRQPSGGWSPR